jgi:glycosyltransferase involved in cell wall biosynthesis
VPFLPVATLDHADLRRRLPHSLRLGGGLVRYGRDIRTDVVQTHRINAGAFAQAWRPGTPRVQFLHSSGTKNLDEGSTTMFRRAKFAYRGLEKWVIPRSADVVVFSQDGADRLSAEFSTVRFSPTWYDPAVFYPTDSPRPDTLRVLSVGRLEPVKDPLLILAAFAELGGDARLTMVGSGTLDAEVRAEIARLGLTDRVELRGTVAKGDVGDLMRDHDVLVMASHFEGYPRVVVEALACGLPVATTAGGEPNGLVVEGVNGGRTDDRTAAGLAGAIRAARVCGAEASVASVSHLSAVDVVPRLLADPR